MTCKGINLQQAVYIIKPEAMGHSNEIRDILTGNGLLIVASKVLVLPEHILDSIYQDMNADLHNATMKYMRIGPSEIGIIEGNNIYQQLIQITGDSVAPSQCKSGTIRRLFGIPEGVQVGEALYYLNGFHRSKSVAETSRAIALFEML